jgi:Protein of unknown function (DUF2845)
MKNPARMRSLMLLGLLLAGPAAAESFRCGQWIASPDMTVDELLEKCGEPTTRKVEVTDVYGPNASGQGNTKRGTVTTEIWTYERGNQSSAMVVTIVDGEIKSMERED